MKKNLLPILLINILMALPSQALPLETDNLSTPSTAPISPGIITASTLTSFNIQTPAATAFTIVPDDIQRTVIAKNNTIIHPVLIRQNNKVFLKTVYKITQPSKFLGGTQLTNSIHYITSTTSSQLSNAQILTQAQIDQIKGQVSSIENDVIDGIRQREAAIAVSAVVVPSVPSTQANQQVVFASQNLTNNATQTPISNLPQTNSPPIVGVVADSQLQQEINAQQSGTPQSNTPQIKTPPSPAPSTLNATSDLSSMQNNLQNTNTLSTTSSTSPSTSVNGGSQLWNLQKVDIRTLIEEVSKETGKNFLLDPRVEGKVTLISTTPLNSTELYRVFLSILATHGFASVPINNNIYKIIPVTDANYQAIPEVSPGQMPNTEQYAVQVIPIQNANATELVNMLRPLLPPSSQIFAYAPTNTIIVTGTTSKVAQIYQIIQNVDQPTATNITIVPLAYASAQELVTTLKSLLSSNNQNVGYQSGGGGINLAADVGANAVLISGPPNQRLRVKNLIKQLDVASPVTQNAIAVVHLHYLNAKDLVRELSNLAGGIPAAPILGTPESVLHTPAGNSPNSGNPMIYGGEQNNPLTISLPTLPTTTASGYINNNPAQGGATTGTNNQILIQAENQTNSVIISAPPSQLNQLKSIIMQLDKRPPEVLVEAVIVDVDEATLLQLGVQWGATLPAGVTNMTDAFTSVAGAGIGVGIVDFGRIRAVMNYLAQDAQTNILATPSLVVLNNQKALIKVGKKVSFVTGQYATSSAQTTATPFTTTDQEDVALTLNVTPQIAPDGSIRLLIKTGNQTLSNQTTNGNPQVNEEQLNTSVIMNNNQILVLGGLISNDAENTDSYLPFLGSIPLIGQLFHNHDNNLTKKNLMVFLHPVIIDSQGVSDNVTGAKYSMMRELQLVQAQRSNYFSPTDENPVLPQWKPLNLPAPFPR